MSASQIYVAFFVFVVVAVHAWWYFPFWKKSISDRWNHFRIRHDRAEFRPPTKKDPHLELVRGILDEASRRAMRLRPKGDDYYASLIMDDPTTKLPSIWVRIKITPKSIEVALEFFEKCTIEESTAVDEFERLFMQEGLRIVSIRCAPRPEEYEFLPHL